VSDETPPQEIDDAPAPAPDEPTVGTGTFLAVGCTIAALLVILLVIAILALFVD
jgi:hypothetical protein